MAVPSCVLIVACAYLAQSFVPLLEPPVPRLRRVVSRVSRDSLREVSFVSVPPALIDITDVAPMTPILVVALSTNLGLTVLKYFFGVGNAGTAALASAAGAVAVAEYWQNRPGVKTRRAIEQVYEPLKRGSWEGSKAGQKAVEDFLSPGPPSDNDKEKLSADADKILVVEDATRSVKPKLIDNLLRGQKRTLTPSLEGMILSMDLSRFFRFGDDKGLNEIASLISDAMKPDPQPVRIILDIPVKATEAKIVDVLSDANELKRIAGDDIAIIVTTPIPLPSTILPALRQALSVVRED